MGDEEKYEQEFQNLLDTLHGTQKKTPPIGSAPQRKLFDDFKIQFIVNRLMGRAWNVGNSIRYENGILIDEKDIVAILNTLKSNMNYTRDKYWISILSRSNIDSVIDSHVWKNGETTYYYDEYERQEIINRCARQIQFRMAKYAGDDHIKYRILDDGSIGLRYI